MFEALEVIVYWSISCLDKKYNKETTKIWTKIDWERKKSRPMADWKEKRRLIIEEAVFSWAVPAKEERFIKTERRVIKEKKRKGNKAWGRNKKTKVTQE